MDSQKKQNLYFGIAAMAAVILACFGFFSAAGNESIAQRALLIVCSILLLILAALYIYIIILSWNPEPNYILFDRLSGRNIPLPALSWRMLNERIALFISENIGNELYLWSDRALSAEGKYGPGGIMRPLVAYKMLSDIALETSVNGEYFRLFELADDSVISALCRIIDSVGEHDMARAVMTFKSKGGSPENFRRYLKANARYIQGRMLGYVRNSIEHYY